MILKPICMAMTLASSLVACGSEESRVTFWQDVAPLFNQRCVTCHQDGGIAPFALDDPEQAAMWADAAASAVSERRMPPWAVTDDGSCGEFRGSRSLSEEEIQTIVDWAAAGAPEGKPRNDLAPPEIPTLPVGVDVQTPNFVPEIQGGDLAEFDEYRCFVVELDRDGDRFLTGYDVLPGNPALIHHALLMTVDPTAPGPDGKSNAERIAELDAESPGRAGWPCFGEAGEGVVTSGTPITWAPGQGVTRFPGAIGVRIRQTDLLVVQMHYNLVDEAVRGLADQSTIRLELAESVEREGLFVNLDLFLASLEAGGTPESLAPAQESVLYSWQVPLAPFFASPAVSRLEIHGVFPHMHEFGRKIRMDIDEGETSSCAADVQRWDFDWQLAYFYQTPIVLTENSIIRVTCEYNTLGRTEPVTAGWGTQNEMCFVGLLMTL